jgi:hypothetical protein
MILGLLTVLIMGGAAYAFWREGPLTAFVMCVNVLVAGVLAFDFWEPLADQLDPYFVGTFAEGTEDAISLMLIFLPVLGLLRWLTNTLAATHMEYHPILYRAGAVFFGALAGYLLCGFLVCMIQTLPLQRDFLTFNIYEQGKAHPLRKYLPPDLVWLAMMHRLSGGGLNWGEDDQGFPLRFDRKGSFELRYSRYRRFDESGKALDYSGEIEP